MPGTSINSAVITRSDQPVQFAHQINTTLTSDNFLLWKLQVAPVLRCHGLMSFVDGSKSAPEEYLVDDNGGKSTNPEHERWLRQDQLILAWIFNSLSPQILAQVVNCETSCQLWEHLHQIYNSQSLAKVLELKLNLQTIRKGNDSCAQYLAKAQAIADRLRSIGAAVPDQDLILYLLQGLGTDFDNFVTAISMRKDSVTMGELQSLLLAHEARQRVNLQAATMVHSANISNQQGQMSGSTNSVQGSSGDPVASFQT